jgi:hypothetical protein
MADFEQVLGEKLAAGVAPPPEARPRVLPFPATPDPGLRFALWRARAGDPAVEVPPGSHARDRGYRASPVLERAFGLFTPAPGGPARPARRPHRLTPVAQAAFDELCRCGAHDLDRGFTPDELKREYRSLALRLHPDRHPEAGAAERARLSATFSRVSAAYRELLAAIARAA